ncbi:hypothetical protein CP98_03916 [Sphingobium yanoikuyae]|uniref:Uncharacterized protein n=1 Tax=Sphingobium yanoikuyae TaxID=13690 RepID=A0A084EFE9_SPHYA|nr:hypothetical protein [Sphingobium yanoikuyae]KEZ16691.1 hypothetical protein CP98_03916 [Sphingobium yanoikuyae]
MPDDKKPQWFPADPNGVIDPNIDIGGLLSEEGRGLMQRFSDPGPGTISVSRVIVHENGNYSTAAGEMAPFPRYFRDSQKHPRGREAGDSLATRDRV